MSLDCDIRYNSSLSEWGIMSAGKEQNPLKQSSERFTGAQALVRALEDVGVTTVFGYPGGQALALYDALYSSNLRHILSRHEQGAVHEADGFARATGKVGVVMVTSGPGATNTVTGIATAYMDSIPLLVISAQVSTEVIGTDSFQESDIYGITMPIVKHSYLIQSAEEIPSIVKEAVYIATSGRPGPVLLDLPSNIATTLTSYKIPDRISMKSYKPVVKGNTKQVQLAMKALARAEKPLVLAGGGVLRADASHALRTFLSKTNIPCVTTLMGKGAVDESESDYVTLGLCGMHGSHAANLCIQNCDVLLACGTRFSDRVTGTIESFAPHATLIHIDIDPAEIGKVRKPDVPIVGDARNVIEAMISALDTTKLPDYSSWNTTISEWQSQFISANSTVPDSNNVDVDVVCRNSALCAKDVYEALDACIDTKSMIVTTDVGQHQIWAAQHLKVKEPLTFLSSGGLGTMGFGLPAAIGASLAFPEKTVICITGDGSFQMMMQELGTAVSYGAAVKIIMVNNSALGMVRQLQEFMEEKRYSQTTNMINPDFCTLVSAYGIPTQRVSETSQLQAALARWMETSGPAFLEVVVSQNENVMPMMIPGTSLDDAFGYMNISQATEAGE